MGERATKRGMVQWYGVDLDGTLAIHEHGGGVDTIGAPIPVMLERVKKWLADGEEVKIVTARVSPEWGDREAQVSLIEAWCVEHLGVKLEVRAHKDGAMVELWDDRAVGVLRNTGITLHEAATMIYDEYLASMTASAREANLRLSLLEDRAAAMKRAEHVLGNRITGLDQLGLEDLAGALVDAVLEPLTHSPIPDPKDKP